MAPTLAKTSPKVTQAPVPMRFVGPMKISAHDSLDAAWQGKVSVPLATYEIPLWHSVGRGARLSTLCGEGIKTTLVDERMTRSILLEADDASQVLGAWRSIQMRQDEMQSIVSKTSRFAKLIDMNMQIVANLLYLRLEFKTGDASGHNMVTQAADSLMQWVLEQYPQLSYSSISGNYCSDKKATAVNGILGRGKYVVAELTVPRDLCQRKLLTTPEKVVDLNIKKNLLGTLMAGGLRSANAHFANMLLGFYLATGQDAANIIEGSQGMVHAEVREGDLYFSCTLPNIIVGTVGNGKGLEFVKDNLAKLGCSGDVEAGANARRLAQICAATVLCGELSLLAAQTNPGELMQAHVKLER
jgi:hydroxymethylglutaryl-CoA reductase (NADPH)